MKRTLVSLVGFVLVLSLVPIASGCNSSGDVLAAGCNAGACDGPFRGRRSGMGGTAYPVSGQLNGEMVSFRNFVASCRGTYPDSRPCSYSGGKLDATVALGGDCQFTLEARDVDDPATLKISGSLDPESCELSGTFDLNYGSCCWEGGTWTASPGSTPF